MLVFWSFWRIIPGNCVCIFLNKLFQDSTPSPGNKWSHIDVAIHKILRRIWVFSHSAISCKYNFFFIFYPWKFSLVFSAHTMSEIVSALARKLRLVYIIFFRILLLRIISGLLVVTVLSMWIFWSYRTVHKLIDVTPGSKCRRAILWLNLSFHIRGWYIFKFYCVSLNIHDLPISRTFWN